MFFQNIRKYFIKDPKGNLIAAEEEKIFVETQTKFIRKLVIPVEIQPGPYIAFVEASTSVVVGSGSDTFEVIAKYEVPYYQQLKFYIIGVAALVALAVISVLTLYGFGKAKKKKEIAELKEKIPLEKIDKLEKELNALEEARKSGFISIESYLKEKTRIEEKLRASKK